MNVEEYISSGILEAYVLDQLSIAERADILSMASKYPEISKEIEKIERSIEALAFATSAEPSKEIKTQLLEKISDRSLNSKATPVISMPSNKSLGLLKFAAAASVMIASVSIVMAFTYWKKWQGAETQLANMIAENAQFAENYNQVNQQLDNIQDQVTIMSNGAYKRIVMNGTNNSPKAMATVYWNETSAEVYLNIQNLKKLSAGQQYQLWAIIDGKPVNAGVFDNDNLFVQMKNVGPNAAAFAVTIEPYGGSKDPSLETMQVLGNV
ncbi:MAG: anti-sigma factor [Bacteroidota bacterium]